MWGSWNDNGRSFTPARSLLSLCIVNEDTGQRVVAALGETAARELLEILERSDATGRC